MKNPFEDRFFNVFPTRSLHKHEMIAILIERGNNIAINDGSDGMWRFVKINNIDSEV